MPLSIPRLLPLVFGLLAACAGPAKDADTGCASTWYADLDGDGYGGSASLETCTAPDGWVATGGDCHDGDATIHPGADETCNGRDDDCDGVIDVAAVDAVTLYTDADGDGFGDAEVAGCTGTAGLATVGGDCDDTDATVFPGAVETCDLKDEDCDGTVDEEAPDAPAWYPDADGDGYGNPAAPTHACVPPRGDIADGTDCDDADPGVNPAAASTCGTLDQDCDGLTDDDEPDIVERITWYADADGDGYGNPAVTISRCDQPSRFVANGSDCDDTTDAVSPVAVEHCDDTDENCNGVVDEDATDLPIWFADADGDGYGDASATVFACDAPAGFVSNAGDCADTDPAKNPAAAELCARGDEDCDGLDADDDPNVSDATVTYADDDHDNYGDPATGAALCATAGRTTDDRDCDDTDPDTYPNAVDTCGDGVDQDCSGDDQSCSLEGYWGLAGADAELVGSNGHAGYSVAGAGDVDGDGLDDLLIGATEDATVGPQAGAAFLITATLSGTVDLDTAGYTFLAPSEGDHAGTTVAGLGDLDGDGLREILVGGYFADPDFSGAAWIVSGAHALASTAPFDLGSADATFPGEDPYDYAGRTSAALGDTDGDGLDDVLIGATGDSTAGYHAGATYVVLGADWHGTQDLGNASAVLLGDGSGSHSAGGLDSAGDWNGDGLDDLLVGAEADDTVDVLAGASYILLSPVSGTVSLSDADLRMLGEKGPDMAGADAGGLGDEDGDGYVDVVVGAPKSDRGGFDSGTCYVVKGPRYGDLSLTDADAILIGAATGDQTGKAVTGPGDMDGDGLGDIAVGAWRDNTAGHHFGTVALFYGPVTGTYSITDADARMFGNGSTGFALDAAGDTDGDGLMDLIIGAPDSGDGGAAWLVRGRER